jgi:hypothetical protein
MNQNFHLRFSDAPWAEALSRTEVYVAGLGGIGSWVTLMLSKMGIRDIKAYDFDTVEEHNVAGQLFGPFHIGLTKAEAMEKIIRPMIPPMSSLQGGFLKFFSQRFHMPSPRYGTTGAIRFNDHFQSMSNEDENPKPINLVLITALDSMDSRKEAIQIFFDGIAEMIRYSPNLSNILYSIYTNTQLMSRTVFNIVLVDPRMSAELSHVVTLSKKVTFADLHSVRNRTYNSDSHMYSFVSNLFEINNIWNKKYYFSDLDVEEGPCSYRSTTFASNATASITVSQMVNAICDRPIEENIGLHMPSGLSIAIKAHENIQEPAYDIP